MKLWDMNLSQKQMVVVFAIIEALVLIPLVVYVAFYK